MYNPYIENNKLIQGLIFKNFFKNKMLGKIDKIKGAPN